MDQCFTVLTCDLRDPNRFVDSCYPMTHDLLTHCRLQLCSLVTGYKGVNNLCGAESCPGRKPEVGVPEVVEDSLLSPTPAQSTTNGGWSSLASNCSHMM